MHAPLTARKRSLPRARGDEGVVLRRVDQRPQVRELVVHPGAFALRIGHCTVLGWDRMVQRSEGVRGLRMTIEAVVGRLEVDRVIFPCHFVPKCSTVDRGSPA